MNAAACYFADPMATESVELARGLRRRDPELIGRLIEQYQHRLMRYLMSLVGNAATAEDLFQETWVRVLEQGHRYDPKHPFVAWLLTIARNLTIDLMRRKHPDSLDELLADNPERPLATSQPSAFAQVAQREQTEWIGGLLEQLSPERREVLVLRFQEDLSLEEIAAITRVPLSTVKSRLYRALEAMAPQVKGAGQ